MKGGTQVPGLTQEEACNQCTAAIAKNLSFEFLWSAFVYCLCSFTSACGAQNLPRSWKFVCLNDRHAYGVLSLQTTTSAGWGRLWSSLKAALVRMTSPLVPSLFAMMLLFLPSSLKIPGIICLMKIVSYKRQREPLISISSASLYKNP